jgi:hypothetical protein
MRFYLAPSELLSSITQSTTNGEDVGEKEPIYTVGGN